MCGDLYPGVLCVVRQVKARFFHMFERDSLLPQQCGRMDRLRGVSMHIANKAVLAKQIAGCLE